MSALQWNVPGMNTARAPRWITERPARLAQAGVRRCLAAAICMTKGGAPFVCRVLATSAAPGLRIERCLEADIDRAQGLADRTVFLCRGGDGLECSGLETGYRGAGRQFDAWYVDAVARLPQVHARGRVDRRRRVPGAGQREGERHREARGVRGGQQLFGIRAGLAAEARSERVVRGDLPALGRDRALAARDVTLPVDGGGAFDVRYLHARR